MAVTVWMYCSPVYGLHVSVAASEAACDEVMAVHVEVRQGAGVGVQRVLHRQVVRVSQLDLTAAFTL